MPLKINNLICTDVWEVALFTLEGVPLAILDYLNNTELSSSSTTTEITAGRGAKTIAVLSGENKLSLNIESGVFDLNVMSLQSGDTDGIYKTSAIVPVFEKFTIGTGKTINLKNTPSVDEDISILLDNGVPLVQDTDFTVLAKVVTITGKDVEIGMSGTIFYRKTANESIEITIDSASKIQYVTAISQATFEDTCQGEQYLGYIVMPRVAVDKNFQLASQKGSGESVHNIVLNAVASCGATELGTIVIYDENEVEA